MTKQNAAEDRGLHAVTRVRQVRERDSRLGLMQALETARQREVTAEAKRERLAATPPFECGGTAGFVAERAALAAMATEVRVAVDEAAASRNVSDEARRRWQQDRTRLRAVELLLERRADRRRAEAERRESHELDDVAGRLWLRRQRATDDPVAGDSGPVTAGGVR